MDARKVASRRVLAPSAVLVVALGGCAAAEAEPAASPLPPAEGRSPGETFAGVPEGASDPGPEDDGAAAAWTDVDGVLYVVTLGSSTCPWLAQPAAELEGEALAVTFDEPGDGPCTADLVPTTTVVGVPAGTTTDQDLQVRLGEWGEITLPAQEAGATGDLVWTP